ncbi:efflux RND transporter periplasmic adaptor subunit [Botryobacter ruber]|uniref:efflux RND transporter periplasmic adaptor subunit n=1 Tax=Botryobacter ruber TaxID=2171629 RepID=UPI000E0C9C72|nr:efflux RND transporter periplasmic adaptor subunit [Botryobacter ruber]
MRKTILTLPVAAWLLFSCSSEQPAATTPDEAPQESNLVQLTPAQLQQAEIETGKAEQRTISTALQVNGVMEAPPQHVISVSVPLGGYLKKTKLLPGMHLKKGELMAELEDPNYIQLQQDYLTTKARLGYLEQEYARQRDLNQSKASSDKVFQQAQAEYQSQRVMLQALAEKLRLLGVNPAKLTENNLSRTLRLYAPIHGYVTKVNVNIGKYVLPTDVLFELVDPHELHLMLTVFEKDLDKLETGQQVLAYRPNQPEVKYPAYIIFIGKDVAEDRSVAVRCHLQEAAPALVPGMFMNAEIEVRSREIYTLPDEAIVRYGNKQYVFTAQGNNIFEMVPVQAGSSGHGYTALVPSPALHPENQTFVTKGAYTLLMQLKNKEEEE